MAAEPIKFLYTCMISALVSGSSGPGSNPGRGHGAVFLGRTLNSHSPDSRIHSDEGLTL